MTLQTGFKSTSGRPTNLSRLAGNAFRALPGSEPIAVVSHRQGQCRWPIGEGPFLFCGCDTPDPNSNYCPAHAAIAALGAGELATVPVFTAKDLERIAR